MVRITRRDILHRDIYKASARQGWTSESDFSGISVKVSGAVNENLVRLLLRRNSSDIQVFDQVLLQKAYSPLVDLAGSMNVRTIIDVGANIGLTSIFFAMNFPSATVYSIEPDCHNFENLRLNLAMNKLENVRPFPVALWSEPAELQLTRKFRDRQEWSTRTEYMADGEDAVEAVTLTGFLAGNKINYVDILKIDIEGSEAQLFKSSEFLQELSNVRLLALEIHEEWADKIHTINLLQSMGFALVYKGETLFGRNDRLRTND